MKINWLNSLVLFLGLLSSLSLAAQSENDDLDCYPMMNPAVIDEMAEDVEAVLGLDSFQTALKTYPTAERFVIHREEGSISIRPRGSAQDIRGIHQDENREIINRLREVLPQELVDDPLLKYQVSSDKTIRIGTDSLSAARLHKIFEKVDDKHSVNPSEACGKVLTNHQAAQVTPPTTPNKSEKTTPSRGFKKIHPPPSPLAVSTSTVGTIVFAKEIFRVADQAWAQNGKDCFEVKKTPEGPLKEAIDVRRKASFKEARDAEAAARAACVEAANRRLAEIIQTQEAAAQQIWNHEIAEVEQVLEQAQAAVSEVASPKNNNILERVEVAVAAMKAARDVIKWPAATTVTFRESQDVRKHSLNPSVESAPMNHQDDLLNLDQRTDPPPTSHLSPPTTIRTAATTVAFRESQDVRLNPSAECAPTNHQNVSNGAYSSSSQLSSSVSYLPSQGTQVEEKGDGAASFSKEIFIAADQAWWQHGKVWRHYKEAPGAAKARAHIMQKAAVDEAEAAEALARTMCPPVVMMEAAEQMITKRSSVQVIWSSRIAQAEQALAQAQAEVRETEWSQTKRAQRTLERAEVIVTAERAALDAIMVQIKGERAFSSAQIAKTESAWTDAMNNAQAAKAMWNHMIATIKWLDHLPHPIVSGKERAWLLEEYKHAEVQETRWTQKIALANFKMAFLKRDKALIAAENASITALADARRVEAVRTEVAWMKARDTAQAAASAWEGAIYASKQFFSMVSREGKMRLAAEIAQAKVQKDKWSKQYASIDLMVLVAQAENSVKKANDCQVVAENYRTEEAW